MIEVGSKVRVTKVNDPHGWIFGYLGKIGTVQEMIPRTDSKRFSARVSFGTREGSEVEDYLWFAQDSLQEV